MADQWIDAATAASIVANGPEEQTGKRSLCTRAHHGLIKARARFIISSSAGRSERRVRNALVPRDLWWAGEHEALKQDWASGDFSTWIDQRVQLQAFGVRFALDGLLDMLGPDRRPAIARSLSVVGSDEWVSTPDAIELVKGAIGDREPKRFIVDQARLGFIAGRAIEAQRFEERPHTELVWDEREWDVPSWLWDSAGWLPGQEDWSTGQFGAREPEAIGAGWMRVSGVHFLTESLEALLPSQATPVTSEAGHHDAPDRPRPGGRLPQTWWDDMWCDVWALIYQGDLKPTSQADVERAMQAWAENSGKPMSEATARLTARKLFKALHSEATNFLTSGS
jgi:hypothetical protein